MACIDSYNAAFDALNTAKAHLDQAHQALTVAVGAAVVPPAAIPELSIAMKAAQDAKTALADAFIKLNGALMCFLTTEHNVPAAQTTMQDLNGVGPLLKSMDTAVAGISAAIAMGIAVIPNVAVIIDADKSIVDVRGALDLIPRYVPLTPVTAKVDGATATPG